MREVDAALHVPQLPNVVVDAIRSCASSRGRCRSNACISRWPATTRSPWCAYSCARRTARAPKLAPPSSAGTADRGGPAFEQDDDAPGSDAADADDLPGAPRRGTGAVVLDEPAAMRWATMAKNCSTVGDWSAKALSSKRTMSGGSSTMRRWPSTTCVSFVERCTDVCVRLAGRKCSSRSWWNIGRDL